MVNTDVTSAATSRSAGTFNGALGCVCAIWHNAISEACSFLKKRTKKLLTFWCAPLKGCPAISKVFCFFSSEKKTFPCAGAWRCPVMLYFSSVAMPWPVASSGIEIIRLVPNTVASSSTTVRQRDTATVPRATNQWNHRP